jgi:sensor histidine kinase YesM
MEKVLMFLSFFLGFLSVVMAFVLSWNTNKLVRTEDERAKRMIDEGNKRTQEMIAETQKMIERMDERHQETMRYLQQSLDYLGSLIKADGEKTRELINKVLEKIPG